jgi:putative hemin transport protein
MTTAILDSSEALAQRWANLRAEQPRIRIRDAAATLGASEAELLATTVDGRTVVRLAPRFREILNDVPSLGKVMALTRNDDAVHERKGVYEDVNTTGHAGLVVGPDIDLRIFFSEWTHGFAISETGTDKAARRSIQFFDAQGHSIHKIFVQDDTHVKAFDALVAKYRADEQSTTLEVKPAAPKSSERPDSEISVEDFRAGWDALKDTHEFFPFLRKFGVSRTQALRLAGEPRARKLPNTTLRSLLELASARELPIMVFVGNPGCIQIHTGTVNNIKVMGPWLNVMDPEFNLHLREDRVAETWVVRKPTQDGTVTSIEAFTADGENIALLFGKRKPGVPEDKAWQELVAHLEAA